jgi:hypothetical protein
MTTEPIEVDVHEAEAHVSRHPERPFALFADEINVHDDFDELPDEIRQPFEERTP